MGQLAVRTVDLLELLGDRKDLGLLCGGDAVHRRTGDLIDQPVDTGFGTTPPAPHPRGLKLEHPADPLQRPALTTGLVDHRQQLLLGLSIDPYRDGTAC